MNLLHASAHAALYLDVRDIMHRLGHRVYSWCVSRQMTRIGHDVPVVAARALHEWHDIDEAYCERFVRGYGPHLGGFDAFIVDHPVCFAALFEHTGRPVIAHATTRYDQGVIADPRRAPWLDRTLQRMHDRGQLIAISNNRGDRDYARDHLGFEWPLLPSLCEYTGIHYTGAEPAWLRQSYGRPPLPQPYAWQDLGRYRGIVHTPYNCSMMSITEHFAAAMPIVVPSQQRLLTMAIAETDGAMLHVSHRRVVELPAGEGWNDYASPETLARWIGLSDWYDEDWMPGVIAADDPDDDAFLSAIDTAAVSRSIAAFLPARRDRILNGWRGVIARATRA